MRAVLLLSLTLLVLSATGAAGQPEAFERQVDTPLTAENGPTPRIADALGRTVLLRGINVVQIGEYFQQDPAQPSRFDLTEQDFADIAALGFDHVRLILNWSLLEPAMGARDPAAVDTIRQALEWARAHDLYVVLDMHQDAWGPHIATPDDEVCAPGFDPAVGWDGAPLWATLTDGLPTCKLQLRELSPAVAQAWQSFHDDRDPGDGVGIRSHLVDTWGWLVEELGADPIIAGYDLLNEPSPGLLVGVAETVRLGEFYADAIATIRAAESTAARPLPAPAYFEPGVEWSAASITATPPPGFSDDTALVFAPHVYAESISPVSIEQGWEHAGQAASLYGTPLWSGEWGYFLTPVEDNDDQLRRFAAEEDQRLAHSAFWDWRQACGDPHNFYPDRAAQAQISASLVRYACPGDVELGVSDTFADVLSRPYPRAVPGTLTGVDADIDTGELTVTGTTDAPGVADVWVPDRGAGAPTFTGGELVALRRVPGTERVPAGGWRAQLRVEGGYTIEAGFGQPATTPTTAPSTQPTTGPAGAGAQEQAQTGLPATGGGAMGIGLALAVAGAVARRAALRRPVTSVAGVDARISPRRRP